MKFWKESVRNPQQWIWINETSLLTIVIEFRYCGCSDTIIVDAVVHWAHTEQIIWYKHNQLPRTIPNKIYQRVLGNSTLFNSWPKYSSTSGLTIFLSFNTNQVPLLPPSDCCWSLTITRFIISATFNLPNVKTYLYLYSKIVFKWSFNKLNTTVESAEGSSC